MRYIVTVTHARSSVDYQVVGAHEALRLAKRPASAKTSVRIVDSNGVVLDIADLQKRIDAQQ